MGLRKKWFKLLGAQHGGPCVHRFPEKWGMLSMQGCLSSGDDVKPVLPSQKAGNWKWLTPLSFVDHIKTLQPELEIPIGLNDPSVICIARGSHKLSQPGPELANSLSDLYAVCMTRAGQVLPLCPRTHLLGKNNFYPELSFDAIMPSCALVLVLHQETLSQIILRLNLLGINCRGSDSLIRLLVQVDEVNLNWVFILTSSCSLPCLLSPPAGFPSQSIFIS